MSVGHLCEYCGQGRVRPFQFSLEQAIITCDNVDCDSRLEVSPWDCIVDRKLRQTNQHSLDQGRLHLWSRSSSSSGVHSDYRSPALSPARSCDSVTDREVENLLRRSCAPPSGVKRNQIKNRLPQYHQSASSDEKVTEVKSNETFSSFFELLNNLDLDVPSHQLVKRECMPMSPLCLDETGVDSVTTELESWMRSFEVPEKTINNEVHSKCSAPKPNNQVDGAETIKCRSLTKGRLYIPSKDSAFSQVSPKKDSFRKSGSNAADSHGASEVKGKAENLDIPCVKSCDVSKNEILSLCDTQFLSPAASAVSDDSGYEDSAIKANLVLLPACLSEKEGDCSSSLPIVEEKKDDLSHCRRSASREVSKNVVDMKVTDSHAQGTSTLLAVVSSGTLSDSITGESVKMDLEGKNTCSQESSNPSTGISLSSSQSIETEKQSSERKTSDNENSATTSQNISNSSPCRQLCDENNDICTRNTNVEECRKLKRPGRPKGSWKKLPLETVKRNKRVPRKPVLRKEEESNVASLKKGLATLLQAPTVQIKKDENRNQNLTNLSLRSRLSGTFVQDPWSVPELYLEELSIEIVVKGSSNSENEKYPDLCSTLKSDKCESEVQENGENEKQGKGCITLGNEVLVEKDENINSMIPLGTSVPKESAEATSADSKVKVRNSSCVPLGKNGEEDTEMIVYNDCADTSDESCSSLESEEASSPRASNTSACSGSYSNRAICFSNDSKSIDGQSPNDSDHVPSPTGIAQDNMLGKFSFDLKNEKRVLKTFLDDDLHEDMPGCDASDECCASTARAFRTVNIDEQKRASMLDYFGEEANSVEVKSDCVTSQEHKDSVECKNDNVFVNDREETDKRFIQFPVISVKNNSFVPSEKSADSLAKDSSYKFRTAPEFTSQFLFDSFETKDIRSWMGCPQNSLSRFKKDSSLGFRSTKHDHAERAAKVSSSKYFSSLLQDITFEDDFFLCPTTENPSSTFNEHLLSSLFFGETAHNSMSCECKSRCPTTTTTTAAAAIENQSCIMPLPTSANALLLPETSFLLEEFKTSISRSNSCSSVSTSDISTPCNASLCQDAVKTTNVHVDAVNTFSEVLIPNTSTSTEDTSPRTSPITSSTKFSNVLCQGNSESNCQLYCSKSDMHRNCDYLDKDVCKCNKNSKSAVEKIKLEPEESRDFRHCKERNDMKEREFSSPLSSTGLNSDKNGQISRRKDVFACKTASSLSGRSERDIPIITVDSDDEFQIFVPEGEAFSEESVCCQGSITSVNIKTEPDMDAKIMTESKYPLRSSVGNPLKSDHASLCHKRKLEDSYEVVNKKWKSNPEEKRAGAIETKMIEETDFRNLSDDSRSDTLLCGIMDNSIVHDANCYSPRSKGFVEFDENLRADKPPENLKFYFGSKTTNFKLCEDLKIMSETEPTLEDDSFSNITLKSPDLKSPSKFSSAFSFNVDNKFGCTKSSPQYESCKYTESDESNGNILSLASKNLSFLCFETTSESSLSSEEDDLEDFKSNETVASLSKKHLRTAISTCESEMSLPTSGIETGTSLYDGSGEESESDCEKMQKSSRTHETELCPKISSFSLKGNNMMFSQPQQPNLLKLADDSLLPVVVPVVSITESVSSSPIAAHGKSSFHHNKADLLNTTRAPYAQIVSDYAFKEKSNILDNIVWQEPKASEKYSQQNDTGDCKPSTHHQPLKSLLHPVAPSVLTSLSIGNHFVNQVSESTQVRQPLLSHSSEVMKSESVIDCHKPSPKNSSVLIPPALFGSYAGNCTTDTLHTSPAQNTITKDSKSINSIQEKIIAVKTMTPSGPVMRLLRVNVVSSRPKENLHVENGHRMTAAVDRNMPIGNSAAAGGSSKRAFAFAAGAGVHKNPSAVARVSEDKFCDISTVSINRDFRLGNKSVCPRAPSEGLVTEMKLGASSDKDCSTDNKNQEVNNESKELYTKIKIGGGDKFYIRPTPAMMRAISNVKKKKQETPEEALKYIELPDGIPISHPLFLSRPTHTNKIVKHRKKEKRKKRKVYRLREYQQSSRKKRIRQLVNKTVEETVTRNKDEIPAMVVVCIGGKLHIYSREKDSTSS